MAKKKENDIPAMPWAGKKKVLKIGGTYYIGLPREFVISQNIKEGDELGMIANSEILITPVDEKVEETRKKLDKLVKKIIEKGGAIRK